MFISQTINHDKLFTEKSKSSIDINLPYLYSIESWSDANEKMIFNAKFKVFRRPKFIVQHSTVYYF
jgi:hypothetical protein